MGRRDGKAIDITAGRVLGTGNDCRAAWSGRSAALQRRSPALHLAKITTLEAAGRLYQRALPARL